MRIVAGSFRGRILAAPRGSSTRPTADRTRQAIFNVLEHAPWSAGLADRRVIDLFAGSGALGLEALSRGAADCLFIDRAPEARAAIARNVETLGVSSGASIEGGDAARLPPRPPSRDRFDLAFLDPPYGEGLCEAALAALESGDWLEAGALVVLERGAQEPARGVPGFRLLDARRWGAANVQFLRRSADG
jgi:16S rRNA (guanine966-N2)-methyltransferase